MNDFFLSFTSQDEMHSVVIEDDGNVAYAYLLRDRKIVGDVWLYNQKPTPARPEWDDKTKIPFLNPASYIQQPKIFRQITQDSEVRVEWLQRNGVTGAAIYIRGELHATVFEGEKPGSCRLAKNDGPLAKRLETP
jgi:hypothetical protein